VQCVAHKQPALTARCAQSVGLVVGERAGGARAARRGVDGAGRAVRAAGAASQQLFASRALCSAGGSAQGCGVLCNGPSSGAAQPPYVDGGASDAAAAACCVTGTRAERHPRRLQCTRSTHHTRCVLRWVGSR